MDVYMQPLIDDLKELWETGVYTYDVSTRTNFNLKVALLWTISDFPSYGMLSGWTTTGYRACPYCPEMDHRSFWLNASGKVSWFDCHRKFLPIDHPFRKNCKQFLKTRPNENRVASMRLSGVENWQCVKNLPKIAETSQADLKRLKNKKEGWWKQNILWDLPYWKTLLLPHNLDVMHIEKNFCEQIINTVLEESKKTSFGIKGKTDFKDNCLSRPKSSRFVLDMAEKKALCEWVCNLKFPDNYASDLSRCVDHVKWTLRGLKSHDCHVFMERFFPVAFKHLLPTNSWKAITEISLFFLELCASTINVESMQRLENNIPEIICKLEKIFPPSFFNSMEHLPIHLPYEAKVGGPVQYRWMYPFERFLNHLKQKIKNKARVEGSICNAYLLEEISNLCSIYFEDHIDTKAKKLELFTQSDEVNCELPEAFNNDIGSTTGKCTEEFLTDDEYVAAHSYIIMNCGTLLKSYEEEFEAYMVNAFPEVTSHKDIWMKYEKEFPIWLKSQVSKINDVFIKAIANGPSRIVRTWRRYNINGYYFRAFDDRIDISKSTKSNGVCVTSTDGHDYYGTLNKVVEVTYTSSQRSYRAVLFKCDWIDNSSKGQSVHEIYKLVDVNFKFKGHNPFVLAHQVDQVYFTPYPSIKKDNHWLTVFKIKPRSQIDAPIDETVFQENTPLTNPEISPILLDDVNEEEHDVIIEGEEEDVLPEENVEIEESEKWDEEEDFDDHRLFSDEEVDVRDDDEDSENDY